MPLNDARVHFVNLLAADAALAVLIGTRIYVQDDLGLLESDMDYPHVSFKFTGLGNPVRARQIQDWRVSFRAVSQLSFDEAYSVYDAAKIPLSFTVYGTSASRIVILGMIDPDEIFDDAKNSFEVVGSFDVRHVESS